MKKNFVLCTKEKSYWDKTRVQLLKRLAFFTNCWFYVDSPVYKASLQLQVSH